jgi:hypothetical protein
MTSNEIDKLEKELSDILDLNKVLTYIEGKKSLSPPKKQPIKKQKLRYQPQPHLQHWHQPQPQLQYQPQHQPHPQHWHQPQPQLQYQPQLRYQPQPQQRYQPQQWHHQYYNPQYNPQYIQYLQRQQPQYNQQYLRYQPQQPQQYNYPQPKNKIPTVHEKCLEYGYKGPRKSKIDNKIRLKFPSVDKMCIEKGYFKPSLKSKEKTSSGLLLGGSKSSRPKKTQRPKPRKSKRT